MIPAVAEVDSAVHEACLRATDYSGCVSSQTSKRNSNSTQKIDENFGNRRNKQRMTYKVNVFKGLLRFDSRYSWILGDEDADLRGAMRRTIV